MTVSFNKTTYAEILKSLEETQHWLNDAGIETGNTRLSEILDLVRIITEHYNNDTIDQLASEYKKDVIFYALTDADIFISIYQSFQNTKSHVLRRGILKKMVNGPLLPWEEDPGDGSTQGRNSLFELEVATKLNIPSVEVVGFDDVDFIYDNTSFNVQCKRLYSPKQISANIAKAAKQFRAKANNNNGLKGIIALSIDKLSDLEESTIIVESYKEASPILGKITEDFIGKYKSNWLELLDIDIVGVMIFVHAIAEVQQPYQLLTSCREVAFFCIPQEETMQYTDYHRIKQLGTELSS